MEWAAEGPLQNLHVLLFMDGLSPGLSRVSGAILCGVYFGVRLMCFIV